MINKHTTEPWAWFETEDGAASCVAEGMAVARCNVHNPFGQDAINARRIVACVNACAGIPTERLEEFNDWSAAGVASAATYRQQRDELLAAIKMVSTSLRKAGASIPAPENKGTIESAIATGLSIALLLVEDAIDSVKGGAE